MRIPPRGTPLLRGTFVLPDPVEEGGRLVFREPLSDTLLPLAVVGAGDLALCAGVAFTDGLLRYLLLCAAAVASFLVVALAHSLTRRPEVVLDRDGGRIRIRRPEHAPLDLPVASVRAVTLEPVADGGRTAPAAGLEVEGGAWLPLHVGWADRRGGDAARVRSRAEAVSRFLGLPLEEREGAPLSAAAAS